LRPERNLIGNPSVRKFLPGRMPELPLRILTALW
jgi:hypothetical protein